MKSGLKLASLLVAMNISLASGLCGTFYVDPSGSDSNPGTGKEPWKTVQKAADTLVAGDTVIIKRGVYNERVTPKNSGTKDAPIVYRSQSKGEAVIDGSNIDIKKWDSLLRIDGKSFLTFDGLEIRNSGWDCIGVSDKDEDAPSIGLVFQSLNVHDAKGGSGIAFGNKVEKPAYTCIRDCLIHHNEKCGIGIFSDPGGHYLIERNRLFENRGTGNYDVIQVGIGDPEKDSNHIVIRQNAIYDNFPCDSGGGDAIDIGGHYKEGTKDYSGYILIEKNLIFGRNGGVKIGGRQGHCILRFNAITGEAFISNYKQPYLYSCIYNNSVVATKHGMTMSKHKNQTPNLGGLQMRNNLFARQTSYVICVISPEINMKTDSLFADGDMFVFESFASGDNRQKSIANWMKMNGQDPHGAVTYAPLESFFGNVSQLNFHLVAGSPAIDAGVPLTATTKAGAGKTLPVASANFFQDGYNGLIEADSIVVGANPPAKIKSIDYEKAVITLESPIKWKAGDPVNLPYSGKAPDCGAYECKVSAK